MSLKLESAVHVYHIPRYRQILYLLSHRYRSNHKVPTACCLGIFPYIIGTTSTLSGL
jgi:hypothetical protein